MPILTFAEAAVHHAGCAQERHVTLMQTRQRPAGKFRLRRVRHALGLAPRRGIRQQVFQLVERKAAVFESRRRTRRNEILALRNIGKRRYILVPPCQFMEL